jgi:hypothetical protein
MKEPSTSIKQCPLQSAEKRLDDCLKLWQAARTNYFDPEGFRLQLNSCIQALRSVTFVLQKSKGQFPLFNKWYTPWQKKMGEDRIMRWLVDSRNTIVKEGDLEAFSEAAVALVNGWNEPPAFITRVEPFLSTEEIALRFLPVHSTSSPQFGLIRVERRWVDSRLPADEILEALSHCFEMLSQLLRDAHRRLADEKGDSTCEWYKRFKDDSHLLPGCMIKQETDRTVWLRVEDGRFVHMSVSSRPEKKGTAKIVKKRYRKILEECARSPVKAPEGLEAEAKMMFKLAKGVLQTDGYHIPMAFLGYPDGRRTHVAMEMPDRSSKYLAIRRLADLVKKTGAESVILISEAWVGPAEDIDRKIYPEDSPRCKEALQLIAAAKSGELYQHTILFRKDGDGRVVFEDEALDEGVPYILLPVLQEWKPPRKYKVPLLRKKVTYKVNKQDDCPCRSGESFEACCENKMSSTFKGSELFREKKYEEALSAHRAHLAQYVIWYEEQTVPLIKTRPEEAKDLLSVDIDAVVELVTRIANCLDRLGRQDEIDPFLTRCMNIIDDERYTFCITVERAFRFLHRGDEQMANEVMSGLCVKDSEQMSTNESSKMYMGLLSEAIGNASNKQNDRSL